MRQLPVSPPLLTADDETRLARRIEAGVLAAQALDGGWPAGDASTAELHHLVAQGTAAWEEFLLANTRLVAMIARQLALRTGMPTDDLFQEGFVALAEALLRFDHTRGRFSTYALQVVRREVGRVASSRAGALGIPPSRAVMLRRALGLADVVGQELGREPRAEDVSDLLGRPVEWTERLLDHSAPVSLEASGAADWVVTASPSADWRAILGARLLAALDRLPGDQWEVLRLRFGLGGSATHSYAEIARRLGISRSTVRRIEERALAALRSRHAEAA